MRATKKRHVWMVNLHSAKVTYKGVRRTMRLCSKCLRRVKAAAPAVVKYTPKPVETPKQAAAVAVA